MMRVSELTGAVLDYWTALAEDESEPVIVNGDCYVTKYDGAYYAGDGIEHHAPYQPSIDWAQGGPLINKYELTLMRWKYSSVRALAEKDFWAVELPCNSHYIDTCRDEWADEGSETALQAICRAVVRAKFGDEVPDINE